MMLGRTALQLGHQDAVQKVIRGRELERTRILESSVVERMLFKMTVNLLLCYRYGLCLRIVNTVTIREP